jgi:hypothetical protein
MFYVTGEGVFFVSSILVQLEPFTLSLKEIANFSIFYI